MLDVEGRVVVDHQEGLELVGDPRLFLVVVLVVMMRVSVSLGADLVDRLGKDDVLVDDVVPEQLPHDVFAKGREEEELELHRELLEGVGGRDKGGDGGVSTEDGVVLSLGLFGREFPGDGALLVNLRRFFAISHGLEEARRPTPKLTF